ncbi:hypothetical protein UFOVP158_10 [uncultured Caudovirales phage]|uniref:Uncharacterized protein n=1 Tax=uncultured Caudovirales phage TaxID=2100421 RepID=A0A6J7WD91_9CAUD|nr:hypothetical protein UFOVP158_10 [uncultured Caudovirales phage]
MKTCSLCKIEKHILAFDKKKDTRDGLNSRCKHCGLHVENNLQVIPAESNIKKGNHFWPDMP